MNMLGETGGGQQGQNRWAESENQFRCTLFLQLLFEKKIMLSESRTSCAFDDHTLRIYSPILERNSAFGLWKK